MTGEARYDQGMEDDTMESMTRDELVTLVEGYDEVAQMLIMGYTAGRDQIVVMALNRLQALRRRETSRLVEAAQGDHAGGGY